MTLAEALAIGRQARNGLERYRVRLAFGATPLHLETFLRARLLEALPDRNVTVEPGLFGDAAGALEGDADAVALVLEWADFDPRLDLREQRRWTPDSLTNALETAARAAARLLERLAAASEGAPAAVAGPTLPLPPAFWTPAAQASGVEMRLRAIVASFLADAAALPHVRVVAPDELARLSPLDERVDLSSWLTAGLPYRLEHADQIAVLLARVLAPPPPKKGLITDLDDTLWRGLVGEIGPEAVSWDLERRSRLHGLYQQLLASLGAQGVLLGVASKNDSGPALEALERPDGIVGRERFFPIEIGWGPKSESVTRVLEAWNVGPDAVVFVDDSPFELAEVQRAHPDIECLLFPRKDVREALRLFGRLRDLFGKSTVGAEDALRLQSLRAAANWRRSAAEATSPDELLRDLEARVTLDWRPSGGRPLELINKTNQFNLNGRRRTESDWRARLGDPDGVTLAVSYEDKFGPLGVIAVVSGRRRGDALAVHSWVMSCRAFSRRIEHRCLEAAFERLGVRAVVLDFAPTERNAPLRRFLAEWVEVPAEAGRVEISREAFERRRPTLHHAVAHVNERSGPADGFC